jgi:hypothetical protein
MKPEKLLKSCWAAHIGNPARKLTQKDPFSSHYRSNQLLCSNTGKL